MKIAKYLYNNLISVICLVALFPLLAFAADAPVPDFTASLLAIWNGIQTHAPVAVILVPVFQLLRTNQLVGILGKVSGKYLPVVIAVFVSAGYVLDAHLKGEPIFTALVTGLFTAGGAMKIYDAIRSIGNPSVPS